MTEKLSRGLREMLLRIETMGDAGLMQLQITANGRTEYNKLRRLVDAGWVRPFDAVLSAGREPIPHVRITDAGRAMMAKL